MPLPYGTVPVPQAQGQETLQYKCDLRLAEIISAEASEISQGKQVL